MAKFCPNCGQNISEKVNYCTECGADINFFNTNSKNGTSNNELIGSAEYWYNQGVNLTESEKYENALIAYNQGLRFDDKNPNIWNNKCYVLQELGKYEEAIKAGNRGVELAPNDPEIWDTLRDAYIVSNNLENAAECSKKILTLKKIEDKKNNEKKSFGNILFQCVIIVIAIFFILSLASVFFSGMYGNIPSSQSPTLTQSKIPTSNNVFVSTTTESPTQRNIRISNEIVSDYHNTHTYALNDYYVCIDMANDVWDMLKTKGINAKIMVGRVDYVPTKITDSNHAWVLAEVAPDQWLALETTGGYSVDKLDNPLYYQGYLFYNPKQTKNYVQLNQQLSDTQQKYNAAVTDYNRYLAQYNQAGIFSKISMKSILDDKELIVQQRLNDHNQVINQINALTESL
jgi:tetratricopeptide (TPR) repeat protein